MLHLCVFVCVGLDPDDFESEEKSDKIKNPNNIQSGKWQLGFQGEGEHTCVMMLHMFLCWTEAEATPECTTEHIVRRSVWSALLNLTTACTRFHQTNKLKEQHEQLQDMRSHWKDLCVWK